MRDFISRYVTPQIPCGLKTVGSPPPRPTPSATDLDLWASAIPSITLAASIPMTMTKAGSASLRKLKNNHKTNKVYLSHEIGFFINLINYSVHIGANFFGIYRARISTYYQFICSKNCIWGKNARIYAKNAVVTEKYWKQKIFMIQFNRYKRPQIPYTKGNKRWSLKLWRT